jgi:phosphohistidine phosphatase
MILYFLRHGLAGLREEWTEDDSLRPLTKLGMKKMVKTADLLAGLDLGLDLIVTSPLTRAFQTADIVAHRFKLEDHLMQDERLAPGFGTQELIEILQAYPEAENIMLVGHEPDFSFTIGALTGGRVVCKKGGLARVDITSTDPLQGELAWLVPPKLLAR